MSDNSFCILHNYTNVVWGCVRAIKKFQDNESDYFYGNTTHVHLTSAPVCHDPTMNYIRGSHMTHA